MSWPSSLACDCQPPCFKDLGMASASYHPPGTARMKLPPLVRLSMLLCTGSSILGLLPNHSGS